MNFHENYMYFPFFLIVYYFSLDLFLLFYKIVGLLLHDMENMHCLEFILRFYIQMFFFNIDKITKILYIFYMNYLLKGFL